MERPKHRRFFLIGFVLLAAAILLLVHPQWTSTPPAALPSPAANVQTRHLDQAQPSSLELATVAAAPQEADAEAPPSTNDTGLHGKVIDAVTRQAVQEFEIELIRQWPEDRTKETPKTRSFKSATGRFSWPDVAAGSWRASVSARGHQRFKLTDLEIAPATPTREFIIPLLPGLPLRGHVFELGTDVGVADAWITFQAKDAEDDPFGSPPLARSKQDGSFVLDGVPAGDVVIHARAQDHAPRSVAVLVDENTPPLEIGLSAGGKVAGTVTTAAGTPLKATVTLVGSEMGFNGQTNEAGRFSYQHLSPGRYRLSASAPTGGTMQEIELAQDEIKEGIALVVEAGRTVRGMVIGLRPDQMQEVYVTLRSKTKSGPFFTHVDQQGAYALTGVPPGRAVIMAVGTGRRLEKTVDVPADQDVALNIVFPAGGRLSGRVTKAGKPFAGKTVFMRAVEDKSDSFYNSNTSADGQYEIEGLPPGDYFVHAEDDISRHITMAGDAVLNIDIPSVQLSARVVEDGGALPIVGAKVYLRGSAPETARVTTDRQTDDFGQFELTGIEPGQIELIVYKPGYEMYREKIAYSAPITNRTIALRKSNGVEVRVRPGSRRFPDGFLISQLVPDNSDEVHLWMPLDREGVGHVPSALAGTTLRIGRFSGGDLIVIEDWDGQPFELP